MLSALFRFSMLLCWFSMSTWSSTAQVTVRAVSGPEVLDGTSPHLVVTGLKPGERATIHSFRQATALQPGSRAGTPVLAHAEAVFVANREGTIDLDFAAPVEGTYSGADALGLLWSGTRLDLTGIPGESTTQSLGLQNAQDVVFRVEAGSLGRDQWAEARFQLTDGADLVEVRDVNAPGLSGAFARPKARSTQSLPAIIVLHGSEGGSMAAARWSATRFAQLGYAAFALNYFAWPGTGLTGTPQALIDIPVEGLATARAWLMQQPGVDAQKVAIWGVSKGAEFALVAASYYDWIDRVVACVPSSVVWSGFGRPPAPGEIYSSWSIAGVGLSYIPYDHYEDVFQLKFSSAFVHQRSLEKASLEERKAARIPIEKTHAKILLLAGEKDVVWPSAAMTNQIVMSLRQAHKSDVVHAVIYPDASHYICGTGSELRRVNPVHKPEGNDPTPEGDAHAAAASWRETKAFLRH